MNINACQRVLHHVTFSLTSAKTKLKKLFTQELNPLLMLSHELRW